MRVRLGQKCLGFEQNRTMSKIVLQILSNRDGICRESYFWDTVYHFPEPKYYRRKGESIIFTPFFLGRDHESYRPY